MIKHEKTEKGDVVEELTHSIDEGTQPGAVGAMVEESQLFLDEDLPPMLGEEIKLAQGEILYFLVGSGDEELDIGDFVRSRTGDPRWEFPEGSTCLKNVLEYGYEKSSESTAAKSADKGYLVCLAPVKEAFYEKDLVVIVRREGRYFASGVCSLDKVTLSSILTTEDPVLLERIDFTGIVVPWFEVFPA